MKFMATVLTIITFSLASAPALGDLVNTAGPGKSFDGRFGKSCPTWEFGEDREICTVSIYRLISRTEDYDEKLVKITAYLAYDAGKITLYPTKERYDAGAYEDSIVVFDKKNIPSDMEKKLRKSGFYVTVIGDFDAKYEGADFSRSGAIREIKSIYLWKHMRLSDDMP